MPGPKAQRRQEKKPEEEKKQEAADRNEAGKGKGKGRRKQRRAGEPKNAKECARRRVKMRLMAAIRRRPSAARDTLTANRRSRRRSRPFHPNKSAPSATGGVLQKLATGADIFFPLPQAHARRLLFFLDALPLALFSGSPFPCRRPSSVGSSPRPSHRAGPTRARRIELRPILCFPNPDPNNRYRNSIAAKPKNLAQKT